jgi:chitinase
MTMSKHFFSRLSRIAVPAAIISLSFLMPLLAWAQQVTLSWDPNAEADLAGYKVHYGTVSGSYTSSIDVHKVTTYSVAGLNVGQTYYFSASAYNASGASSGYSNEVTYAIPAANGAPTAPAVPNGPAAAMVGATATFTTSATDPNGDTIEFCYNWGNGVTAWGAATQSYAWPTAGTYIVTVLARDSKGAASAWSGGKAVTVSQNQVPAASAGAGQTVNAGSAVVLTGSASDPEGAIAGYLWRQTGGTTVTLNNAQTAQASFTAPAIATGTTVLTFEFKATDAGGLSAISTNSVTVLSPDIDGDGVANTQDAFATNAAEWRDSDGDGIGDNADPDDNNNGILDADENPNAPGVPVLISPVAEAVVDPVATLKAGAFRSPVAGVTHAKSRWQIFREDDDACVFDVTSKYAKTSLNVPKFVLDEATQYFWRVQYIDSKSLASPWSEYGYFATENTGRDANLNGIPDAQQVGATVDLDKDGVKDVAQTGMKAVKVEGTPAMIGVSIKGAANAIKIESIESENTTLSGAYGAGKPKRMPFGLINFKIAVAHPGDTVAVKIYFSEPAPLFSKWYKYDGVSGAWYDFSSYAKFSYDRRSLTLTLRDGGPGDADGIANGVIVDPAGIGVGGKKKAAKAPRR